MRINSSENNYKYKNRNVSNKGGREVLRTLSNPDSLASTVVLESFVTGGRSANAYKRGGFPEFRERFTDDVVSAVFWMKGVDIFNKIGDKFGEKVLKLPTTNFDVGKDALRNPFQNLVSDIGRKAGDENAAKAMEKKLAGFKFTKIILSSILATCFVGFMLPKINQSITEKMMSKNKKKTQEQDLSQHKTGNNFMQGLSFEDFEKNIDSNKIQSFKGLSPQMFTSVANCLENNKVCKLVTCDVGILAGRVKTARNEDEAREYFFRDTSSSFFYYASTPLIFKMLQSVTKSSKLTNIDSVTAKQLNNMLVEQLKQADGSYGTMQVKDFAAKTMGSLDDKVKEIISKLPFKSDVISLNELKKHVKDENLLKRAAEMANLQPEQAGIGKVLTKQQVTDVFKSGSVNNPEFLQKAYSSKFGKALTDPYKYIPMKKITKFKDSIDGYTQTVIDTAAKKNGGVVDKKLLDGINKKSYAMSAGFRIAGIAISAIALGVVIPKLQYAMTKKRTGSDKAPGLRKYEENDKEVKKGK